MTKGKVGRVIEFERGSQLEPRARFHYSFVADVRLLRGQE